jgi:hypothetical protein
MHHVIFIGLAVFLMILIRLMAAVVLLFPAVRIIINAEMVLFYNVFEKNAIDVREYNIFKIVWSIFQPTG